MIINQNQNISGAKCRAGLRISEVKYRGATTLMMVVLAMFFAIIAILFAREIKSDLFSSATNDDRFNYVERINYLKKTGAVDDIPSDNIISLVTSELGWQYLLLGITFFFEHPENGLNLISVISLSVFTLFCLRYRTPPYITFIFLLNPIVIDLVVCQLRSALALAILLLTQMSGRKTWYLIGGLIAQFFHFSAVIFIVIYVLAQYISANLFLFSFSVKKLIAVGGGILLALSVLFGRAFFLSMTGDYRFGADYPSSSIQYSFFWFCLLFSLVLLTKKSGKWSWQYYYAIFILSFFLILSLARFYNARFIALTFPVILNSIKDMPFSIQYLLYGSLFLYQIVQYYYWLYVA